MNQASDVQTTAATNAAQICKKGWLDWFNEANELHKLGRLSEAANAYLCCFKAGHPYPAEALSASMLCSLKNGERLTEQHIADLQPYDKAYEAYLAGADRLLNQKDPAGSIAASGNAFESFHTGTEADRFFLNAIYQNYHTSGNTGTPEKPYGNYGREKVNPYPSNIIFYWDQNPPAEVEQNFEYHKQLARFDVQVYDKQRAEAFIYDYYGREARKQFTGLRHPAEEADYFRAHAMFAYGGCYLDSDLRLRSTGALLDCFSYTAESVVFLTHGILAHNDLILAKPQSKIMDECIKVISSNCSHFPSLGIVMKTGPGAFVRAINRLYFRHIAFGDPEPSILLRDQTAFDRAVVAYDVSYKQDSRNWKTIPEYA